MHVQTFIGLICSKEQNTSVKLFSPAGLVRYELKLKEIWLTSILLAMVIFVSSADVYNVVIKSNMHLDTMIETI